MAAKYTSEFCKKRCNKSKDNLQSAKSKVIDYSAKTTTEDDLYNFIIGEEIDRVTNEINTEITKQINNLNSATFKVVN